MILASVSCENLSDPGEIKFKNTVMFSLATGNSKQKIYIYNTYPVNYSFEDPPMFMNYNKFIVENAKIKIIDNNTVYNNFKLVQEDSLFLHKYYSNTGGLVIKPDHKYSIEIESNGQLIKSSVTTIGNFEILSVKEKESSSYNISWGKCQGAVFYDLDVINFYRDSVFVSNGKKEIANIRRERHYIINGDTLSSTNAISQEAEINSKTDSMYVTVGAYDLNTYKYFFEGIGKLNIENAYGYLGSSTVKSYKKYIK